jgi:acyl-CoA reductase-like NAD-dependent aldehyde dehydrogenase
MAVKLVKNCRFLVRVRDYETAHIEVGAEVSHFDVGYDNESWAGLPDERRERYIKDIHALLDHEVDRLAREELETVAKWSEISPNLAEDYLETIPLPVRMQRNHHAKKTDTQSAPSGGVRGRRGAAAATTPARSRRPA